MFDDPHIGLVGNVDVDVVDRGVAALEHIMRRLDEYPGGELEDLTPVHLDVPVGIVEQTRAAAGQPEALAAPSVGPELEAEKAPVGRRLEHDRARAVAEEDERRTVLPVEDPRE